MTTAQPPLLTFAVSPDFDSRHLPGWYVVNTWLQRHTGLVIDLQALDDFATLHRALDDDRIDLVYANAYDAARLVRDRGFVPLVRPHANPDEVVVAVAVSSPVHEVEQLHPGTRVATTDHPDVNLVGMILLEPADLGAHNLRVQQLQHFVNVAKALLYGEADVGFFLAATFDDLAPSVRQQLRVLVRSEIFVISHLFLVHPRLSARVDALRRALMVMDTDSKGLAALDDIGVRRWEPVAHEEVEFMIDVVTALDRDG